MLIVLTTVSDASTADELAQRIIGAKLAGCVQILPQMKSVYMWKGEVQNDSEHLLLIKTVAKKYSQLEEFIATNSHYETPEIIAIKPEKLSVKYQNWLNNELNR